MNINSLAEACYSAKSSWELKKKQTYTSQEEYYKDQHDKLDYYRNTLEKYVHSYLTINYGPKLDEFWKKHTFPKKSKYAFAIVERRCDPYWWFLLRNLAWAGPDFSLYIFCSTENYEFLKALLGDKLESVHLILWFKTPATREEGKILTNRSFKNAELYKQIEAEYMLRFELDTYLCRKVPKEIFQGDFYGAPWAWAADKPGGGGLTVRKISSLIRLCEAEVDSVDDFGEDGWIGERIVKHGFTVPPLEFRQQVFQENFPLPFTPVGVHQFWTFLDNYDIDNRETFITNLKNVITLVDL